MVATCEPISAQDPRHSPNTRKLNPQTLSRIPGNLKNQEQSTGPPLNPDMQTLRKSENSNNNNAGNDSSNINNNNNNNNIRNNNVIITIMEIVVITLMIIIVIIAILILLKSSWTCDRIHGLCFFEEKT